MQRCRVERRRRRTTPSRARQNARDARRHIRVIATPNGGGFGGKSDPFNDEIVVAVASVAMLDRPVKIRRPERRSFIAIADAILC